jgi:hypothetical protein
MNNFVSASVMKYMTYHTHTLLPLLQQGIRADIITSKEKEYDSVLLEDLNTPTPKTLILHSPQIVQAIFCELMHPAFYNEFISHDFLTC